MNTSANQIENLATMPALTFKGHPQDRAARRFVNAQHRPVRVFAPVPESRIEQIIRMIETRQIDAELGNAAIEKLLEREVA